MKRDLAKYARMVPDTDDVDKLAVWKKEGNKLIYAEGYCDGCLTGTGLPPMEAGEIGRKIGYIQDLMPRTFAAKAKEKNLVLARSQFVETPEASFLYGVTVGEFTCDGKIKVVGGEYRCVVE